MIERLNTLTQSPLPAITTLNLRSNRLQTLSGIEKLYSLERIDIRDNNIKDPTELARLTGLPNIIDVYVAKNHFTRTHPNYRITIFNLFRSTPGYSQDITIDSQGPTSQEKKQLVDRVPEAFGAPIVKPEPEEDHSVPGATHDLCIPTEDTTPLPPHSPSTYGHRRHQSDLGPRHSQRKKKATRRRIVELSQAETPIPPLPQLDPPETEPVPSISEIAPLPESEPEEPTTPDTAPDAARYTTASATQARNPTIPPTRPHLETSFSTPAAVPRIHDPSDDDGGSSAPQSPQDATDSVTGNGGAGATDLYKQKIESLKTELGPNWLTALNDDRFSEDRSRDRSFSPASQSSTIRPGAPRGVSVGGRTLG